jgi:hypothetical protein
MPMARAPAGAERLLRPGQHLCVFTGRLLPEAGQVALDARARAGQQAGSGGAVAGDPDILLA